MKNLLLITGSILLLCILITSFYAPPVPEAAEQSEPQAEIRELSEQEQPSSSAKHYYLAEYDKKIAAFEQGQEKPIYISDVYVSTLPKADIALMKKGIPADSEKELKRLIEDYCS